MNSNSLGFRYAGDYLREKYDESTQVKMNKRGRLQVKDSRYKVPTALDLVYLDESPDWCRQNKQLQWAGKDYFLQGIYISTWGEPTSLNFGPSR